MALPEWTARRVDSPAVAGGLVATAALVFSTVYLFVWPGASITRAVPGLGPGALVPVIVCNAFLVTVVVWSRTVSGTGSPSCKRLGGAGLLAGLFSHLTLGAIAATAFLLWDENGLLVEGLPPLAEVPGLLVGWVGMSLFVGVYSIPFTFGIPVLLSVGIGVGLARVHEPANERLD